MPTPNQIHTRAAQAAARGARAALRRAKRAQTTEDLEAAVADARRFADEAEAEAAQTARGRGSDSGLAADAAEGAADEAEEILVEVREHDAGA